MSVDSFQQLAREHLDAQLMGLHEQTPQRPADGWIASIRRALGMSSADLARRMGVSKVTAHRFEASETSGTIKLQTLERVAAALDCHLVYSLVPNDSLAGAVRQRAEVVAPSEFERADHTMRLEGQLPARSAMDDAAFERRVDELMDSPRLWREDDVR